MISKITSAVGCVFRTTVKVSATAPSFTYNGPENHAPLDSGLVLVNPAVSSSRIIAVTLCVPLSDALFPPVTELISTAKVSLSSSSITSFTVSMVVVPVVVPPAIVMKELFSV